MILVQLEDRTVADLETHPRDSHKLVFIKPASGVTFEKVVHPNACELQIYYTHEEARERTYLFVENPQEVEEFLSVFGKIKTELYH